VFNLILFDINKDLCEEFQKAFNRYPNVTILHSTLENLPSCSCVVSPANSFGMMDGGIDLAITNLFGTQLMKRVQQYIIENYAGEQPVGTSFIIETENGKYPYLAHTPTMKFPMDIRKSENVYQAMKAMLLAVNQNKNISSVACSGFGTATGRVPYDIATKQMALAYEHFLNRPSKIDWSFVDSRIEEVYKVL